MKKLLLIIFVLLFGCTVASPKSDSDIEAKRIEIMTLAGEAAAGGTWTHREVKTKPDGTWIVEFTRDTTGEVRNTHFSRKIGDGSDQLDRKKWNLEVAYSQLMTFCNDKGFEDCDDILRKLIIAIRAQPTLTKLQAESWYDANYPDSPWKGDKLLEAMQKKVEEQTGQTVTWDQFKTYVQNNIFEGIDNYVP